MKKVYALYDGDMVYSLIKADDLAEYDHIKSSLKETISLGYRESLTAKYDPDLYIVETTEIMDKDYMRNHKKDAGLDDWPDDAAKLYALSVQMNYLELIFEEKIEEMELEMA